MLPVADPPGAVWTVTSASYAISVALSSTSTTAKPSPSFTFDVVSRKNGSAKLNDYRQDFNDNS